MAPNKIKSTPINIITSSIIAVSTSNLTLTVVIFNKSSTIGNTNGKAKIDIIVLLPESAADITDTNVKTIEIPNIPSPDPIKNRL